MVTWHLDSWCVGKQSYPEQNTITTQHRYTGSKQITFNRFTRVLQVIFIRNSHCVVNEARSSPGELRAARHWNCDGKQSTACPQKRPMFSAVGRHTTVPMSTDTTAYYVAYRLASSCRLVPAETSSTQKANPSAGLPVLWDEKQIQGVNQKSRRSSSLNAS